MTNYLFIVIAILAFSSGSALAAIPTDNTDYAVVENTEEGCNDSFQSA